MRKAEAANGQRPEARDWSDAELRVQDEFVIQQAELKLKRKQSNGKADWRNGDEIWPHWTETSEADESLPGAGLGSASPRTVTRSWTASAPVSQRSPESDSLFSGLNSQLIHNLPIGLALIWVFNAEDVRTWRIAAANKTAKEIIGGSLVDYLLTRVANSFPFHQKMEEVYENILRKGHRRDLHWQVHEVGGIRRTYAVTGFAVGAKYLGLLMQDVTAHREVRGMFVEQKLRYEEVSKAIGTFLWKGDTETLETKWVSSESEKVLGYWPEHWCKMPNFWLEQIDPQDREMVERAIREEAGVEGARFDYRMKAADGRTVWLHAVIHVSEDASGKTELTGVMVDITKRKLAEEAAQELSRKLLRSQDEERRHVARELHDSLGQYLSVLGMNVGTLARTVPGLNDHQEAMFTETTDLLETCSRELRTLSYLMHPPMLDEVGLVPALEWYASGFAERSKIQVEVDAPRLKTRLPRPLEMAFFRITQEALTNIYRHSRSKTAEIRLHEDNDGIMLKIGDSGGGLDMDALEGIASGNRGAKGIGIRGMRERMCEMGGTLNVVSSKGGTMISAHVPRTASVFAKKTGSEQDAAGEASIAGAG